MREYGKVFSAIWESADFRSLSEDGRTLVMYLLTCQHGTIAGVFRVPDGYACEDLQWSVERVSEGFQNLKDKGFATRCEASKWVWVTKFLEWNPPENPNQRKAAAKVINSIPSGCAWKPEFMRVCGPSLGLEAPKFDAPHANPSGTVVEPFLNQYQEQKQEQEQKQNTSGGGGAAACAKPKTPEQLRKAELWRAIKALLVEQGEAADLKAAGAIVTRIISRFDEPTALAAIDATLQKNPAGVIAYLEGACQQATGQRPNKQEALEAGNLAAAERFAMEN